jgi:hypothetical protein
MTDSLSEGLTLKRNGFWLLQRLLTHRFAVLGPLDTMVEYRRFDEFAERCRDITRQNHAGQIRVWQSGVGIMVKLFEEYRPDLLPDVDYQNYDQICHHESQYYRLSILGLSTRTTKASLDLCLDGYYSQSLALCRSMYETYKRSSYTRLRPKEVFRFMDEEAISEDVQRHSEYHREKDTPNGTEWRNLENELESREQSEGDDVPLKLLRAVKNRMDYLNNHAHPGMEGVTDLMARTADGLDPHVQTLHSHYSRMHADQTLRIGASAIFCILVEMRYVLPVTHEIDRSHGEWMQEYKNAFPTNQQDLQP